jgi:tellurite methyltransferase
VNPVAREWREFYDAVAERPPHDTVLDALQRFAREGRHGLAVDLGCGDGRDTVELLRRGWRVVAIDSEPEAIDRLRTRTADLADAALETLVALFEDATWPAADLVNAGFSLPFCPPEHFEGVWERVRGSIQRNGRFSGQLFGDRDEWVGEKELTFHPRATAIALFEDFVLERFEEVDEDGRTATGEPKHWHVYHVVARRGDGQNREVSRES